MPQSALVALVEVLLTANLAQLARGSQPEVVQQHQEALVARKPVVPSTKSKKIGGSRSPNPGHPYGNTPKGGKPDNGNSYKTPAENVARADSAWMSHLNGCASCAGTGLLEGKNGKRPCPACGGSGIAQVTSGSKTPGSV
jgi:hypothetical protein